MEISTAVQLGLAALQLVTIGISYGRVKQMLNDIDRRVIRIEKYVDDKVRL